MNCDMLWLKTEVMRAVRWKQNRSWVTKVLAKLLVINQINELKDAKTLCGNALETSLTDGIWYCLFRHLCNKIKIQMHLLCAAFIILTRVGDLVSRIVFVLLTGSYVELCFLNWIRLHMKYIFLLCIDFIYCDYLFDTGRLVLFNILCDFISFVLVLVVYAPDPQTWLQTVYTDLIFHWRNYIDLTSKNIWRKM